MTPRSIVEIIGIEDDAVAKILAIAQEEPNYQTVADVAVRMSTLRAPLVVSSFTVRVLMLVGIIISGFVGFSARAVPDLNVQLDTAYVYTWTPTDPTDHSYSGTITVYGLYSSSGMGVMQSSAGAILTYSIMTPAGLFTPENSYIASPSTRAMAWDGDQITSMSLIFVRDDPEHNLLRAKDHSIALAVDPPGQWLVYAPDVSNTFWLLMGTAAALIVGKRVLAAKDRHVCRQLVPAISARRSPTPS